MTDQSDLPGVTSAGTPPGPDAASPSLPLLLPGPLDLDAPAPAELVELAQVFGVATEFWDWQGAHVPVATRTILGVLAALDVPIRTGDDVLTALEDAELRPWRLLLPDVVVIRQGESAIVPVHVDLDLVDAVEVWFEPEDGTPRRLAPRSQEPVSAVIDGRTVVQLAFELPGDLPLGWHALRAQHPGTRPGPQSPGYPAVDLARPYVVTPVRLELPPSVARDRAWGFMTQLYSVRSQRSWGLGDLADLKELVSWSAREHGAGFVLINPLHAAEPIPPMEASPYLPTTRRFINPIYLRLEDIREVAYLPATERAIVEWQAEAMQALNADPAELDRDAVWAAKCAALESIYVQPRSRERQASFEAFCDREGQGLADFAMWSVLAERYGLPTDGWPAHALDPRGDAIAHMHFELSDRVQFHMWLQWCLDEQLASVARVAKDSGMPIGVVHDLAVGVHPDGADAWALRDVLARGVTAGAPPDAFNQQGQDWSQPPWRPDRLVERGYAPYRDMLRTVLRHAGALRIDHIIGLFRFWWVPRGNSPVDGTYVRYDHEALIGILALEAQRAGAFVIGEDLGTVEPWAREYLLERGILGTSILWFEKDGQGEPLPPERWRSLCLATVNTHDLPPTAGYLAGEHVELRERLGLLTRPLAEEWAIDEADRQAVLDQLTDLGLLGDSPTERDKIEALHVFLTLTPARLIGVALADAVGDRRTMNQPGTSREYPNWRLPLADGVGQPMLLEDAMDAIRVISLARTVEIPLHEMPPAESSLVPEVIPEPLVAEVAAPEVGEKPGTEPVAADAEPGAEPVAADAEPVAEPTSESTAESTTEVAQSGTTELGAEEPGVGSGAEAEVGPVTDAQAEPEADSEAGEAAKAEKAAAEAETGVESAAEAETGVESAGEAETGVESAGEAGTGVESAGESVAEPKMTAESEVKPEHEAEPESKLKAESEVESDNKDEDGDEPEAETAPGPKMAAEPEVAPELEAAPESEVAPEVVPESEAKASTESQAEPDSATEPAKAEAVEAAAEPEPAAEAAPEAEKAQAKGETEASLKADPKADPKADLKPEADSEADPEATAKSTVDPKGEAKGKAASAKAEPSAAARAVRARADAAKAASTAPPTPKAGIKIVRPAE